LLIWKTKSELRRRKFIDNFREEHRHRLSDFYVPTDAKKKCLVLDPHAPYVKSLRRRRRVQIWRTARFRPAIEGFPACIHVRRLLAWVQIGSERIVSGHSFRHRSRLGTVPGTVWAQCRGRQKAPIAMAHLVFGEAGGCLG
jgi:hypothetical protein